MSVGRVFLMLDSPKGPRATRHKVQSERWRHGCVGVEAGAGSARYTGHRLGTARLFVSRVALNRARSARSWWLVQARNAAAARRCIAIAALHGGGSGVVAVGGRMIGEILDAGGAS